MSGFVIGPVPAESNPSIESQFYQPNLFNISAITRGQTTTVTTTVDHNYVVGQLVRLIIPPLFGANQLNEQSGLVISIPASDSVVLTIFSLNADPFVANPSARTTQPQILAIGDLNSGQINTGRTGNTTYVPGSFINISPQ